MGGARFFPPENKLMILTVACQTPEQYGYEGQTHWTISSLVEALIRHRYFERISWTTVQRFLRGLDIKPHKMDYYLFCDDPELIEKAKTICDLYLHPPKDKVRDKYPGKKLTIVLDNLSSHKTENVKEWLKKQKGEVEFVFTPTHASWLNQIELWFKGLNQKCLKRVSVESLEELEKKIGSFIKTYNKYYKHPYNWKSDGILQKKAA